MEHLRHASLVLAVAWLFSGCRTATHVTEVPRVDLQLSGGNRGYLIGTPPPAPALKTTRQIIETDVEVPSFYKPTHSGTHVTLETPTAASAAPTSGGTMTYDTYVVKKGESLWSIAAKPEIYGQATAWRRIFDANRALLKSPERVRAGMKLKIPRGTEASGSSTTYGDAGATYKK